MADGMPPPTAAITVGGKASSLSSASVFSIAYKLAQVRIDSSALDKLSSATPPPKDLHEYRISFPDFLTPGELRASLAVTLSKLLLSSNNPPIRPDVPNFISHTLNSGLLRSNPCTLQPLHVTKEERAVLDYCLATLDGICAVVDYGSSALCAVADVVAALSCEASKANISVFNSLDSGDGFSLKDEVAVASDLKVLLNGSKFVGKVEVGAVTDIPRIHGSLREATRAVHSRARVELNSGLKGGFTGTNKAWEISLSSLVSALRNLGHSSLSRIELNLDSIADDWLKSNLTVFLKESCPTDHSLREASKLALEAAMGQQYGEFLHLVNELLISVRKILSSEMSIAIMLLEGSEWLGTILNGTTPEADVSIGRDNSDKKAYKKKKKAVLGKGTTVFVQLVKDKVQSTSASAVAVDKLILLKTCAERIISILDPRDEEFDSILQKIKEIVESNETRRLPKLPKGTRDFAKEQMAVREKAFSIIAEVFKRHGAMALDTPAFEMRETLMGKYGEDSKLIYDLADQGGELCSLRYDLTVPFARYVAMNGLTSFKRYQIAKVYRRDNPSKGRYREFYQCDFDIAGQYEKMGPDFEVVKILTELLDELNIGEYEIKLNHRKLLDGMLDICGVPSEKFRTICSSIDKLDKLPFEQVKKEMVEEKGLTEEVADKIGTFVKKQGRPLELLAELKQEGSQFLGHEGSKVALDELEIMFKALEKSKCITKVVFDLSLARGLDYYTGVIFEAVFKGTTQVGSIAAGGRYDNLIGMFGTKQVPAVGASLGIERVFAIMEQIQKDQNQVIRACETEVLVSVLFDDLSLAAELVSELWSAKIKAEYMVTKRVMKHIDRAKEFRIPYVVFVGERELGEGIVKIKDIENAMEEAVPRNAVVEELKKRLSC